MRDPDDIIDPREEELARLRAENARLRARPRGVARTAIEYGARAACMAHVATLLPPGLAREACLAIARRSHDQARAAVGELAGPLS